MSLLGGRLEIESAKGEGTSVRIVLPRSAVVDAGTREPQESNRGPRPAQTPQGG